MIKARLRVGLLLLAALALMGGIAVGQAQAVDLGNLAGAGGGDMQSQLVSLIADKLGVKLGGADVAKLFEVGKQVSGSVIDPSKLADLGLAGLTKGANVDLMNLGKNLLQVSNPLDGAMTKVNTQDVFGGLGKMFQ